MPLILFVSSLPVYIYRDKSRTVRKREGNGFGTINDAIGRNPWNLFVPSCLYSLSINKCFLFAFHLGYMEINTFPFFDINNVEIADLISEGLKEKKFL
jgi:hypothetical protein